jgi:site-specific DNA-methyltransferase (adenine-specific)
MIWLKPSTPFPGNNRYGQVFEFMYILAKGKLNIFNPINDRKNIYGGYNSGLKKTFRDRDGSSIRRNKAYTIPEYGPRHNVWKIGVTEKKETNHPATFPEELVKGHILTWSNEGDLIYDCFLGSGSTAKVAKQLNRNYLGSEVSQEYYIAACKRINRTRGLVCIER